MGRARQLRDVSKVSSGPSPKDLGLFSALVTPPSGCLRPQNQQTPTQKLCCYTPTATTLPPPVARECQGEDAVACNTSCGNSGPAYKQLVHFLRCAEVKAALSYN